MKIKLENENNSPVDAKASITATCFTQESICRTGSNVDEMKQIEILIKLSCFEEIRIKMGNETNPHVHVTTLITGKCITLESICQNDSTVDGTKQIEILIKVQKEVETMILSVKKLTVFSKVKNLGATTRKPSSTSSPSSKPTTVHGKLTRTPSSKFSKSSKSSSCQPPDADICLHKKLMN